jgi:hypothetical protein
MKEFILKDRFHESQIDNFNPDGSSNMSWSKTWGRFNQCFISSSTMSLKQCFTRIRDKGLVEEKGTKGIFVDEIAYMAILLARVNKDGDAWKNNDGRYWWKNHCDLLNQLTDDFFKSELPGEWVWHKQSLDKIIEVLKSNYQPIVGIYIGDYYRGGEGHVTTVVGWRETDNGEFLGLIFNDPAGNLIKKGSYKNAGNLDGKEVFYPKEVLNKILGKGQIMYFREKSK